MRHLISLSLKYIRRQKLRSLLTFLCITLSVFILSTMSFYFSSFMTSIKNMEIISDGSWEADFSELAMEKGDLYSSADIITNHAVVSDSYCNFSKLLSASHSKNSEGRLSYFNLSIGSDDKTEIIPVRSVFFYESKGNPELDGGYQAYSHKDLEDNQILAPELLEEHGYKIGDTITISFTPASGVLSEDSAQVKAVRDKLARQEEETGKEYPVSDDPETEGDGRTMLSYLLDEYSFDEILFSDIITGSPTESLTFEIAGFCDSSADSAPFQCAPGSSHDLEALCSDNPEILGEASYYGDGRILVRINDNIDFDDGIMTLYKALGFKEEEYHYYAQSITTNSFLLALELKGADAVVELMPMLCIGFFLIFIGWAIARFVIDNAFEISVRERSAQFASLRIMGASKTQLLTLVLSEAVFYSITALPIGLLAAYASCRAVFTSLNYLGIGYGAIQFSANPTIIALCVFLCGSGIFISSYTSAMWASRKLSPAEALNYGKPTKKRRKEKSVKKRKSKLSSSSKGFILRYTMKNIFRTKSRFIISSVALALGVLMFTVCTLLGFYLKSELNEFFGDNHEIVDFYTYAYDIDALDSSVETLSNKKLFSDYRISASGSSRLSSEKDMEFINSLSEYRPAYNNDYLNFESIDRERFEKYLEPVIGFSYDEFISSQTALFYAGSNEIPKNDKSHDFYSAISDFGYDETPVVNFYQSYKIPVSGVFYSSDYREEYAGSQRCLIFPIENAKKLLESENSGYDYISLNVYAVVNGQKNYDEALKTFEELVASDESFSPMENAYMFGTGLSEFIATILKAVLAFLLSIWLVGILSMINSINTSVLNRQPELMMMRSVGMSRRQLYGTVILESLMFSVFSTIIGTALGIGAMAVILKYAFYEKTFTLITTALAAAVISIAVNAVIAIISAVPGIKSLSRCFRQYRT